MKSHFLISDEEKNRIRNLHESRLQSFGTGNVIKEQSWIESKVVQGEHDPLHKDLGLLSPTELIKVLKGCSVPIPAKCKGKNIMQDKDCKTSIFTRILGDKGKYGSCLSKAVRKYKS